MKHINAISRIFLSVSVALVIAISLAPARAADYPIEKVVIGLPSDPSQLDPQITSAPSSWRTQGNIFDPLFRWNQNMEIIPHLALSIKKLDPLTWEIKLRRGVRFHNGEPFNAEAVKFSIARPFDKTTGIKRMHLSRYWSTVKSVEIVDSHTVRFITDKPDPIMPRRFTGGLGPMVPPNYIKKHGHKILQKRPVGTGAYKFVRWDKDEQVVLEANEDYWGKRPKVKRAIIRTIPEVTTRLADFRLGRVDIAMDIPMEEVDGIEKDPHLRIDSGLDTITHMQLLFNTLKPGPLANKKVRQAIHHAVDMDSIIKHILYGYGRRTPTVIVPDAFGYDPSIKLYPYDPKKARKLLAEAGYPNGFEVNFDFPTGHYNKGDEVAQAIMGQLAEVGIRLKMLRYEWGSFVKRWRTKKFSPIA